MILLLFIYFPQKSTTDYQIEITPGSKTISHRGECLQASKRRKPKPRCKYFETRPRIRYFHHIYSLHVHSPHAYHIIKNQSNNKISKLKINIYEFKKNNKKHAYVPEILNKKDVYLALLDP